MVVGQRIILDGDVTCDDADTTLRSGLQSAWDFSMEGRGSLEWMRRDR